jgi:LCP family protein required for cell wall assembly
VYRRRRIAAALALLLVLGLVVLAGGWGYTAFRFRQISSVHVPGLGKAPADGSLNLLVVGSDTRQGLRGRGFGDAAGQRSDVIMLVHLVPAARHAAVLSIPRDLYVPVAGTGGSAKINSAFNHGPGQLVQTIQQSLEIPVHHYLLVNFDGFREVVDALGGVELYFPRPVRDDNHGRNESGLDVASVGCRRLDGGQALALARSRYFQYQDRAGRWHADPGTDLGRIRRQQTMLRALAANAVGRNLANPLRANALVGSVVHSLTKDDRLTIRRAVTLVRQFRAFDPARLTTITLPVDRAVQRDGVVRQAGQPGFDAGLRQGWEQILLPRQPDTAAAVARFLSRPRRPTPPAPPTTAPPPEPLAPSRLSVAVRNATPRQGLRPHHHRPAPPRLQGHQRRQRLPGPQDGALVHPRFREHGRGRGPGAEGRPGGRPQIPARPRPHLDGPDPRRRLPGRGPPGQAAASPDPTPQADGGDPLPAPLGPPPLLTSLSRGPAGRPGRRPGDSRPRSPGRWCRPRPAARSRSRRSLRTPA